MCQPGWSGSEADAVGGWFITFANPVPKPDSSLEENRIALDFIKGQQTEDRSGAPIENIQAVIVIERI